MDISYGSIVLRTLSDLDTIRRGYHPELSVRLTVGLKPIVSYDGRRLRSIPITAVVGFYHSTAM